MPMRSIWSGRLGFGLVGLNVKLYKGVSEGDIGFHLIHPDCGKRVNYQVFCSACEKVVERASLKRGYEYVKGEYVVLDDADFQSLPLKSVKQIEIEGFTQDDIDPRAFDTHYLLAPDKGGANEKPFALLYRAMDELKVKAIAKLCYRDKEHLCVISPYQGVFLLQTLFYADELRDVAEIRPKEVAISDREVELGKALVGEMMGLFDYERYHDEYREALEKLISAKLEGRQVSVEATTPITQDLTDALLKSIAQRKGG